MDDADKKKIRMHVHESAARMRLRLEREHDYDAWCNENFPKDTSWQNIVIRGKGAPEHQMNYKYMMVGVVDATVKQYKLGDSTLGALMEERPQNKEAMDLAMKRLFALAMQPSVFAVDPRVKTICMDLLSEAYGCLKHQTETLATYLVADLRKAVWTEAARHAAPDKGR